MLRLIRSRRVGPATFHRLIADHGSAAAALAALPDIAAGHGVPVVEINPADTELSAGMDHVWRASAATALPALVAALDLR